VHVLFAQHHQEVPGQTAREGDLEQLPIDTGGLLLGRPVFAPHPVYLDPVQEIEGLPHNFDEQTLLGDEIGIPPRPHDMVFHLLAPTLGLYEDIRDRKDRESSVIPFL
jgi:hypothetical protein